MDYFRLRIRDATNTSDELVVTSVPDGENPYIAEAPSGDGQGFNPRTGRTEVGAYTVPIADNGVAAAAVTDFIANASGRYDKLGRFAYLESGTDGITFPTTLVAGYVTAVRFPAASLAVVAIGETQRTEQLQQAFSVATSTFPATTMLAGGPVRWPAGAVMPLNLPNLGAWTVERVDGEATGTALLRFRSGYVLRSEDATDYQFAADGAFPTYMRQRINSLTAAEIPERIGSAQIYGIYRHGRVVADVYQGETFLGTFPAITFSNDALGVGAAFFALGANAFMLEGGMFALEWLNDDPAGTQYQVYLYTRSISEESPIHILAHPVDIVTGLMQDAGEVWDAESAGAVRAEIGDDVLLFLRITASEATDAFIARLQGLFGFGRRLTPANVWEFFTQRSKAAEVPSEAITLADLREIPTEVWTHAEDTIVNRVTVRAQRFAIWAPGQSGARPADSLVPVLQARSARFQLADGSYPDVSQGEKGLTYEIPGLILSTNATEVNLTDFTAALGAQAFDRWGFGSPRTTLACLPSIVSRIGDETRLSLAFLPNTTGRGGQRIVQVVQRTNEAGGPLLVVEDAGSAVQAPTTPAFTVDPGAQNPRAVAVVELTNAATLADAGITDVPFEFAVSALEPTTSGQDIGSIRPAAPTTLTTPEAAAGSRIWVRARALKAGHRPSEWGSWHGLLLDAVGAPSALSFTASDTDGAEGELAWTAGVGSSDYPVSVLLRLASGSAASDRIVAQLLPGSTRAALAGLTPGAAYVATVAYSDQRSGLPAASATLAFGAGDAVDSLTAPTDATVYAGRQGGPTGVMDGSYGLAVVASVIPGSVEVRQAVETAPGSGVFGDWATIARVAAVLGGWTTHTAVAPNDGRLRRLASRSVRGEAVSAWTAPLDVLPWSVLALRAYDGPAAPAVTRLTYVESESERTYTLTRSAAADAIWVYDNLVAVGEVDPYDLPDTFPTTILPLGTDEYTTTRPPQGYQRRVHFVPRTPAGLAGAVRNEVIDPAPSALAGSVKAAVTDGTADLTIAVRGSPSNFPIAWVLHEDAPDGAVIASGSVSAPTTYTPVDLPALGARPLPLREMQRWVLVLTDVGGIRVDVPSQADRDALASASVTPADFLELPSLAVSYDDDTDAIRFTVPGGLTRTLTGLSGGGVETYTVGDLLDDSSDEAPLTEGETREPYLVEVQGGGVWSEVFRGPLHGAIPTAPPSPGFTGLALGTPDYGADTVTAEWDVVNVPSGVISYNVTFWYQTHITNPLRGQYVEIVGAASPLVLDCQNDIDAAGTRTKKFQFFVVMVKDADTVVATSATTEITLPSNT